MISKREYRDLKAYTLRAIVRGKYRGITSTKKEIESAKKELKRRGLKLC